MRSIILAAILSLLTFEALAQDLEAGLDAYDRGDYATALANFRPLAEQGDSMAQGLLGSMYFEGTGVPQDPAKAAHWIHKAAERGWAVAQSNLGSMYAKGMGVRKDLGEAAHWLHKAAKQGDAKAQFNLAALYHNGKAVRRDEIAAHMWANLAARNGFPEAPGRRNALSTLMSDDAVMEAQRRARRCLESGYQDCD